MAKDPAFLFYSNDFLAGTFTMTDEQVGKYIRLLCLQHQKYDLTENDMKNICKTYDIDIYDKFILQDGKYYNVRLRQEADKRKAYAESRRKNKLGAKNETTYVEHMEDVNEDVNEDKIINENSFEQIWQRYPKKDGRKQALKHYLASVKNNNDIIDINLALDNYLKSDTVARNFIKNGSTWFNNWRDWIPEVKESKPVKTYNELFGGSQ